MHVLKEHKYPKAQRMWSRDKYHTWSEQIKQNGLRKKKKSFTHILAKKTAHAK